MSEQTQEQTKKAPTMEETMGIIKINQQALDNMCRLALRDMLGRLTSNGVSGIEKKQIKESIERAVMFPYDFGINVTKAGLLQQGKLSKPENHLAAYFTKLIDNTFLLRADNMLKNPGDDLETESTKQETKEETNV